MAKERPEEAEPVTPRDQIHHPNPDYQAGLEHAQYVAAQNPEAVHAGPAPHPIPVHLAVALFTGPDFDGSTPGVSPTVPSAPDSPLSPMGHSGAAFPPNWN